MKAANAVEKEPMSTQAENRDDDEPAALRKDAERYRWLRKHINGERWHVLFDDCGRNPLDNNALDCAIDAEMANFPVVGDA